MIKSCPAIMAFEHLDRTFARMLSEDEVSTMLARIPTSELSAKLLLIVLYVSMLMLDAAAAAATACRMLLLLLLLLG